AATDSIFWFVSALLLAVASAILRSTSLFVAHPAARAPATTDTANTRVTLAAIFINFFSFRSLLSEPGVRCRDTPRARALPALVPRPSAKCGGTLQHLC